MVKATYKGLATILQLLSQQFNSNTPVLRLFTAISGNSFTPDTDLASITEASYAGYSFQSVTPISLPFLSQGIPAREVAIFYTNFPTFRPTDGTIPNTILGYVVVDSPESPGNVLFGEVFDSAVVLDSANRELDMVIRFGLDPAADYGQATISD